MEAKRIISARYADNDIDIENISSDFSELLGVDGSVKNVSSKTWLPDRIDIRTKAVS